jgi:hypothetical protein
MNTLKTVSIFALGVLAFAGCERKYSNDPRGIDQPKMEEPKTADRDLPPKNDELGVGGGPIVLSSAIDKIADARCDREMKCGNVASGKKWADRNACVADMKKSLSDELNANDCPAGIDTKELNECLHEARNEDCKNPFDKIGRVAACRTSDMCRHVK